MSTLQAIAAELPLVQPFERDRLYKLLRLAPGTGCYSALLGLYHAEGLYSFSFHKEWAMRCVKEAAPQSEAAS